MDRTIAPQVKPLEKFELIKAQEVKLDNNINKLYLLNNGQQKIIRLEVVFDAGSKYDSIKGVSFLTSKMLLEGTDKYTATEIQDKIAELGAFVETHHGVDRVNFTFYVMNKFLKELLDLLENIFSSPTFPKTNFDNLVNISKNNIKVNLQKNSFLASQEIKKTLFGKEHYYGYSISEKDLDTITLEDVRNHCKTYILNSKVEVFVSGFVDNITHNELVVFLDKLRTTKNSIIPNREIQGEKANKVFIQKPDALQSSIRIGKVLFNRNHENYFKMLIVNEILGGYFGSRLMKNIREEKGLTYGISSQLVSLNETGYFVIGTDVKKENTHQALEEIYKEIEILRSEETSKEELDTVTNYMHGSYLASINSPFAIMDKFKTLHYSGQDYSYYDKYIETLKSITKDEVLDVSRKYLGGFHEVVVGNYS